MNTNYKLYIFDLDGTLVDSAPDLTRSANQALAQMGLGEVSNELIAQAMGQGADKFFEKIAQQKGFAQNSDQMQQFQKIYMENYNQVILTKPYPGVQQLLKDLKARGNHVVINTNKKQWIAEKVVDMFFPLWIDGLWGDNQKRALKPSPEGVHHFCEYFQIPSKEAVYIGDSEVDSQTAENAQIDCVLLGWGTRSLDYLSQYKATLYTSDIKKIRSFFSLEETY